MGLQNAQLSFIMEAHKHFEMLGTCELLAGNESMCLSRSKQNNNNSLQDAAIS